MLHGAQSSWGLQEGIQSQLWGKVLPLGARLRAAGVVPAPVGLTLQGGPTDPLGTTIMFYIFYYQKENKLGLQKCFHFSPHIRKKHIVEPITSDSMLPTQKKSLKVIEKLIQNIAKEKKMT